MYLLGMQVSFANPFPLIQACGSRDVSKSRKRVALKDWTGRVKPLKGVKKIKLGVKAKMMEL